MAAASSVSIILLAGGQARRLPGKLSLRVNGQPLLLHVFGRLTAGAPRPCVISIHKNLDPELRRGLTAPLVRDRYSDCGPLGGLASAAAAVRTPLFFAAAGDSPFVSASFIDRLEEYYFSLPAVSREPAVTVRTRATGPRPVALLPRHPDGRLEPLAALYRTQEFLSTATAALQRGERKITAALSKPVVYFQLDAASEAELINVNTIEDWQRLYA